MNKQILSEEFLRMQKLAGIITESQLNENEEVNLLQFIKDNQNEIAKKLEVDRLVNISEHPIDIGNVSATMGVRDHQIVSLRFDPDATFQLGDKTYNIKYVIDHPEEFLGKNVMYKNGYLSKLQKKKIGKIDKSEGEVGFPERRITSTDIDFSTKPFKPTDEEESLGKIKINGKTIYYVYYG
jgi:hypothetical protein